MNAVPDPRSLQLGTTDLLLLDLDGTVVDIAPRPDAVMVDDGLKAALGALMDVDPLALVVVTGRALSDADQMLAPLILPAIASHGAEVRVCGAMAPVMMSIGDVRPLIETLLRPFAGAVLEWKPFGVAVHVRNAPELAGSVAAALDTFAQANRAFRVERGRCVFEIVPGGVSKSNAVRRLLGHEPYAARRPIYVGDDRADEAAMREVEARGGIALRVAGEFFGTEEAAFLSPGDVRAWLAALAQACGAGRSGQFSIGFGA